MGARCIVVALQLGQQSRAFQRHDPLASRDRLLGSASKRGYLMAA
jgi:hypothetical protein